MRQAFILFFFFLSGCLLAQESAAYFIDKGSDKYKKGRYKEAIQLFSRAIEKDSSASGAYIYRAIAYDASDDFGRALVDFSNARKIDSNDVFVFTERAQTFLNLNELDAATLDFQKLLQINPNGADAADAFYYLGRICFKQGKFEQAINYYTRVLKFRSDDPEIFFLRGEAKYFLGDCRSALKDFDLTLQKDDENGYAYFLRGNCHLKFGNTVEACKDFKKALKNDYPEAKVVLKDSCVR